MLLFLIFRGPGFFTPTKLDARLEANKLAIDVVKYLIEEGHCTTNWIVQNLDTFMR
jgi:hypothetical protein